MAGLSSLDIRIHIYFESFRTTNLNSEGMLRGTDNFYFILNNNNRIINRIINIFLTGVPI